MKVNYMKMITAEGVVMTGAGEEALLFRGPQ